MALLECVDTDAPFKLLQIFEQQLWRRLPPSCHLVTDVNEDPVRSARQAMTPLLIRLYLLNAQRFSTAFDITKHRRQLTCTV